MKISVFGTGYVGLVSSACLAQLGHNVIGVDILPEKVSMLNRGESPIIESGLSELVKSAVDGGTLRATHNVMDAVAATDISLISVGTPSSADGSISISAVRDVLGPIGDAIRSKGSEHTVVVRSTIPPGMSDEILIPMLERASGRQINHGLFYYVNPEFLREGTAIHDFHNPPFTLVGAQPGDDAPILRTLYGALAGPVNVTSIRVAESVKFLSNAYHALKLAFANEAGAILGSCGVDARVAFQVFCEDRQLNISPAYLRPGFAFGGSCLPKDVRALVSFASSRNIATPLLRSILPSNEQVIERAYGAITKHERQPVALFGLSFKPGTDDLRESPFVTLAERLLGKGYDLTIFDERVDTARLMGENRRYIEREIPHLERLLAPTPMAALNRARIAIIGHVSAQFVPQVVAALRGQVVIDLAGVRELERHSNIQYEGLCW